MALRQSPLFTDRTPESTMLMGVVWDDVTLQVDHFVFRLDLGNRNVRFTLTRISDGAIRTHDFVPGQNYTPSTNITWNPPFPMAMLLFNNPKIGQTVGLPDGWTAELAVI